MNDPSLPDTPVTWAGEVHVDRYDHWVSWRDKEADRPAKQGHRVTCGPFRVWVSDMGDIKLSDTVADPVQARQLQDALTRAIAISDATLERLAEEARIEHPLPPEQLAAIREATGARLVRRRDGAC